MSADAAQYEVHNSPLRMSSIMEMDCETDDVADLRVGRLLDRSSTSSGATLCPGPKSYNMVL